MHTLPAAAESEFYETEVTLGTGATLHAAYCPDFQGCEVKEGAGSRAGQAFIAADGARIPNRGQMTLSLRVDGNQKITSTFQVCQATRPLWSVGKICDSGCEATFNADKLLSLRNLLGNLYAASRGEEVFTSLP